MKQVPDLSLVENAREFLSTLTIKGKRVHWVELEGGRRLHFDRLTDQEAVILAKNLYFTLFIEDLDTSYPN